MTGLEKIVDQIISEANRLSDEQIKEAESKAESVIAELRKKADAQADKIISESKLETKDILERAVSSAQLEKRNKLLTFKQKYIDDVIQRAKKSIEELPDDKYFEILIKLLNKYTVKRKAVIKFGEKDIARLPDGFENKVKAEVYEELEVSKEPCGIKSGFILVYDGIDINCSFDAVFESEMELLKDKAGEILFS